MHHPAVRNCLNGSVVLDDLPTIDVHDPSEGGPGVPLSRRREVDRAVESARAES